MFARQKLQISHQLHNTIIKYFNHQHQILHLIKMREQEIIQAFEGGSIASSSPTTNAKSGNWVFISVQYLLQGILSALPQTIILTYIHVPNYLILSLFQAVKIPSTIKFLFAPVLETYTSVFYGKRKSWIIISGVMMGLLVIMSSFYTTQSHQITIALIFLISLIFNSCADISVDALSLKQIVQPQRISLIQSAAKKIGHIIGGFVFLKLVSNKFGSFLGLSHAIMSVPTFFRIIGVSFIGLQVASHLFYKQQILEQQIQKKDEGICDTIKQYRVFFNCKQKYFRTGILLMVSVFGLLFFSSSYQFQLMKKGFSKQRINEIHTVAAFPIIIIAYFYSKLANQGNMYKLSSLLIFSRLILYFLAFFIRPQRTIPVIIYLFVEEIIITLAGITDAIIINYFPVTAVSGMMVTMLNSMKNIGHNFTFHLMVVNAVGHRTASIFGLAIHAIFMIFGFKRVVEWVKRGELDVHEHIVHEQVINDNIRSSLKNSKHESKVDHLKIKLPIKGEPQFLQKPWEKLNRSVQVVPSTADAEKSIILERKKSCSNIQGQPISKDRNILDACHKPSQL